MIGYKATYNGKCKSITYEIGKTYTFNGTLQMYQRGFHFCKKLKDVFICYKTNNPNLKVFKINILGDIITDNNTSVTNKFKVIKEIDLDDWQKKDANGNLIYYKNSNNNEYRQEFDGNNNLIYCKDLNGIECWQEFDVNNNVIHYKNSDEYEYWQKFDENNNLIYYKNLDGNEYWQKFDTNNNLIYYKDSNKEYWKRFDKNNNLIYYKDKNVKWSIIIE